ncbi:MAG: hypothetical protein Q8N51_17665, partial [Gammaproteobacteria bacterium]|nr:hypothetical protein [Gammaproteobacteria bacterium]
MNDDSYRGKHLVGLWVLIAGHWNLRSLLRDATGRPPGQPHGLSPVYALAAVAILIILWVGIARYSRPAILMATGVLLAWPSALLLKALFLYYMSPFLAGFLFVVSSCTAAALWYLWRPSFRRQWDPPFPPPSTPAV